MTQFTEEEEGQFIGSQRVNDKTNSIPDGILDDHTVHECDIALNNFEIKKKRYRVLLNRYHIIWQRSDIKHKVRNDGNEPTTGTSMQKENEHEKEKISYQTKYDDGSNVLHLQDVFRITKGSTKAACFRSALQTFDSNSIDSDAEQQSSDSINSSDQYLMIHYAERIISSPTDCNRWQVQRLTLHNNDPYIIGKWYDQLQNRLLSSPRKRLKRLLVFINPYGGRKMALQTYERCCKPIIQLAGIDASCIITQRANQIRDILIGHDLKPYDAVCCVGGDGTVAEMINGLIWRSIRDHGMNPRQPDWIPKPSLPIGVIPAGSTDTIAYSLHGTSDVQTATIHLVLGQYKGLDVCSVRNCDGIIRFCTSVMGYGYLGDVAAKSEKYRWMGTKRYEYTGVKTFLLNRGYEAEVHLLLDENDEIDKVNTTCSVNCSHCQSIEEKDINADKPSSSNASPYKDNTETCHPPDNCDKPNDFYISPAKTSPQLIRSDRDTSNKWRIIRGDFFMITGANITCACTRSPNGISRYCHLGDGYLDLVLVRKTNLLNNIRFVINTMGRNGDIRNLPFVEIYRTRQFTFKAKMNAHSQDYNSVRGSCQPIAISGISEDGVSNTDSEFFSSWNCDGEVVSDLEITMISHRQLIDVFMRGPYPYAKPTRRTGSKSLCCCCCK
uniref:DAGKc domain-containing protein n=1 Tax=Glossina palpalis gambiensis TaxID=67801 RepID=A0A1B0BMT1_9MUSC